CFFLFVALVLARRRLCGRTVIVGKYARALRHGEVALRRAIRPTVGRLVTDLDAPAVRDELALFVRTREHLLPAQHRFDPRHALYSADASSSTCQTSPHSFCPPSMYQVSPVTKSS